MDFAAPVTYTLSMNALKFDFIYKQYRLQTFLIRHGIKDLFANGAIPSKKDLEDLWTDGEILYGIAYSNWVQSKNSITSHEICRDWQENFANILPVIYMYYYSNS